MNKKSRILLILFVLIVTTSIVVTYYKYIIKKDINIETDKAIFDEALTQQ